MKAFLVPMSHIDAQWTQSLLARDYAPSAHCDNCANDLPAAYVSAMVQGESVTCCSGACLAEVSRVWAPRQRVYPIVPMLVLLVLVFLTGWR